ncbi:chemotaxis protein [Paramagnetospirillum kuznetsovii]|uniref:Chemotaxis protein n=1 Tax=Paramagnetospirillum kuznetsovii TaxID=2053833 RepID=A0A364P0G5_9PROT|nr:liposome tubulation protein MamY [Paramagnetospirillum kuznetsovii]RAU22740.1 chemotaxis protein [Paramagnetospirillum kuznetsovii]
MLMGFNKAAFDKLNPASRTALIGAIIWTALSIVYLTIFNGWKNLFTMLPHEFFIVLLSIALPIGLTVLILMLSRIVKSVDTLKSEVTNLSRNDVPSEGSVALLADLLREHRTAIAAQAEATADLVRLNQDGRALAAPAQTSGTDDAMTLLAQLFREHREAVAAQLEAQASATAQLVQVTRDSRDGIVDELRSQRVLSQEITQELSQIAQSRNVAPVPPAPGLDPSQRIDRMRALAEVLGLALNDLSMTATQVLTQHLNAAHGDRDGTRKFISTLTTAYFAGDKNVFFRSLAQEAVNRPEQLRRCAEDTDNIRQQISKILREAREIRSLVAACDPNDLVRIVFEDGELWALEKALTEHFLIDGSPVWTEAAPDSGTD